MVLSAGFGTLTWQFEIDIAPFRVEVEVYKARGSVQGSE